MRTTDDRSGSEPDGSPLTDGGPQAGGDDTAADEDDGYSTAFILALVVVAIPVLIVVAVIASAVIGAFVLGLGGEPPSAPMVTWQSDYDESTGTMTIEHVQGDAVDAAALEVHVAGESADWSASADRIGAGDTITVRGVERGQTVQIVWKDDRAEQLIGDFRAT